MSNSLSVGKRFSIVYTTCLSPQLVEAYGPVAKFHANRNHMYIKYRKNIREELVQKKYKIMEEDI